MMISELDIFNPELMSRGNLYLNWVNQVNLMLVKRYGNNVDFKKWLLNGDKLTVYNTSATSPLYE